jgi:hypothetical protein
MLCFIIGILLLPASVSVTIAVFQLAVKCPDLIPNVMTFFIGFVSHLIFFLAFRKPMLAYVVGHELTHALWVLMFRGRVSSISVSKNGGAVKASKVNPLIILAPYFFPIYTLVVIGIWLLLSHFYVIQKFLPLAVFFIGFTWSFHLLLNLHTLTESQPDIRAVGRVFSAIIIYTLNVFILGLLITFVSQTLSYRTFFNQLTAGFLLPYWRVMDWLAIGFEKLRMMLSQYFAW